MNLFFYECWPVRFDSRDLRILELYREFDLPPLDATAFNPFSRCMAGVDGLCCRGDFSCCLLRLKGDVIAAPPFSSTFVSGGCNAGGANVDFCLACAFATSSLVLLFVPSLSRACFSLSSSLAL